MRCDETSIGRVRRGNARDDAAEGSEIAAGNEKSASRRFVLTAKYVILLVPLDGIELSTFALRMRCSTD
jgi:hypothetical protein